MRNVSEWLKQADYDLETARFMFAGKRYFYTVFMCHLAVEKALKGLFTHYTDLIPPKTHNLIFLTEKAGIKPPEKIVDFIHQLNGVSIPTRYPDSLTYMKKTYTRKKTSVLLEKTEECLSWLMSQLKK